MIYIAEKVNLMGNLNYNYQRHYCKFKLIFFQKKINSLTRTIMKEDEEESSIELFICLLLVATQKNTEAHQSISSAYACTDVVLYKRSRLAS